MAAKIQRLVTASKPENSFKCLTDAELQLKREKGPYYRCDERYIFGYKCKNLELQVLVVQEEGSNELEEVCEEEDKVGNMVELSVK